MLNFETIDNERNYLGKWLPFTAKTKAIKGTESFMKRVLSESEKQFPAVFTIRRFEKIIGLTWIQ